MMSTLYVASASFVSLFMDNQLDYRRAGIYKWCLVLEKYGAVRRRNKLF